MSIIVSDVSYHYFNQHTLFESVSFSVSRGGKVSLIGNNGVGKSTLLKLLAGELMEGTKRGSMAQFADWTIEADKVLVF